MDGWNILPSYWVSAYFQVRTVSLSLSGAMKSFRNPIGKWSSFPIPFFRGFHSLFFTSGFGRQFMGSDFWVVTSGLILKLEGGELAILEATGGATGPKKTAGQGGFLGLLPGRKPWISIVYLYNILYYTYL